MAEKRVDIEIARLIGVPINPNQKVPVAISEICNMEPAAAGELIRIFKDDTIDVDDIYGIGADGGLTKNKVLPTAPVDVVFSGLQSKLEYVLIDEVLPVEDQGALARKKAGITRAMDKKELALIITGILGLAETTVPGVDLYENILAMKHAVEDYGDNYILLVSSDVKEAIDTYEFDNAVAVRSYLVSLKALLAELGITVIKVIGKVNGANLITAKTGILVARESSLVAGKPITFFRRTLAGIATEAGIEAGERLVSVAQVPTVISSGGLNSLGYGCFGYESISLVIVNYRAIAWNNAMIA